MLRSDFHYELPGELIAQAPADERRGSRLLVVKAGPGGLEDRRFPDLPDYLRPGDLLVVNDTRVMPARLFGRKPSGGRAELLVERLQGPTRALCHLRVSKKPVPGARLLLDGGAEATLVGRDGEWFEFEFDVPTGLPDYLQAHGHMPLPPYIERADHAGDRERYQTVYARRPGAVAAPTAGLHFDEALLEDLDARGIARASLTLHVGAGTFQPMRVESVAEHRMHAEWVEVDEALCAAVAATRERGGRVVAVGTTVVRALEAAAAGGELQPFRGETRIFITPGYRFRAVDLLVTNFHLPESTLLMLVCAFGGYPTLMRAYRHAVAQRYRFFSYGDAMLLFADPEARA